MKVEISVDQPDLRDAIRDAIERSDPALLSMLEAVGAGGAELAQTSAPARTGYFSSTIGYEVEEGSVLIGSSSKTAHIIERGRRPGRMANAAVIGQAFGLDRRQAFTVARSIGRSGTKGHETFEQMRRHIEPEVHAAAVDFVREIELGRGR